MNLFIIPDSSCFCQVAISLLNDLLQIEPSRRPTAKKALRHRYLSEYHDSKTEPSGKRMDNSFEKLELQVNEWRGKCKVWPQ